MKTRHDFVSNSSSSSFIISFNDSGKCIDKKFIEILKQRCNSINVSGVCKSKKQYDDLKERIISEFGQKCLDNSFDDEMSIYFNASTELINPENKKQVKVIRCILALDNSYFSCGCGEDWGDDFANAVQTATILECKYKEINIEGDDHLDYCSIRGTVLDDNVNFHI